MIRFDETPGGRYQIKGTLVPGKSGSTYVALDLWEGNDVCLKRFTSSDAAHVFSGALGRIVGVDFPGISRVTDLGVDQEGAYLVSELIHGAPFTRAAAGDDSEDKTGAIFLASHLLRAIDFIHRRGILHRDLKPDNILLDLTVPRKDWNEICPISVIDFGMSQEEGESATRGGTPLYLAPELWEGESPTVKSDLYAVGVVLAEFCTGLPWSSKTSPEQVYRAHIGDDGDENRKCLRSLTDPLAELALWLTKPDPAQRPESASDALLSLGRGSAIGIPLETAETRMGRVLSAMTSRMEILSGTRPKWLQIVWESETERRRTILEFKRSALVEGRLPLEFDGSSWRHSQDMVGELSHRLGVPRNHIDPLREVTARLRQKSYSLILTRISSMEWHSHRRDFDLGVEILLIPVKAELRFEIEEFKDSTPIKIPKASLASWLEGALGHGPHEDLLEHLDHDHGSYSEALLREMLAENLLAGTLRFASNGVRPIRRIRAATSARDRARDRFSGLGQTEKALLEYLAVMPTSLSRKELSVLVPHIDFDPTSTRLRQLDLIKFIGESGESLFRIAHEGLRDVIRLCFTASRESEIARTLIQTLSALRPLTHAEMGHLLSVEGLDPDKARESLLQAAIDALTLFDLDGAESWLDRSKPDGIEGEWLYWRTKWATLAGTEPETMMSLATYWETEKDKVLQANMLSLLGECAERAGSLEEASTWFRRALDHPALPIESRYKVQVDRARVAYRMGDLDQAVKICKAIAESDASPEKPRARAMSILALVAQDEGRDLEASRWLSTLLPLAKRLSRSFEASALVNSARSDFRTGRLMLALDKLKRAVDLFSQEGEKHNLTVALCNIVEYQLFRGRLSRSKRTLQEAREVVQFVDDGSLEAGCWLLQGRLCIAEGSYEQAVSCLDKATAGFRSVGESSGQVESLILRASLEESVGNSPEAHLKCAENLLKKGAKGASPLQIDLVRLRSMGRSEASPFREDIGRRMECLSPLVTLEVSLDLALSSLGHAEFDEARHWIESADAVSRGMDVPGHQSLVQGLLALVESVKSSRWQQAGLTHGLDALAKSDLRHLYLHFLMHTVRLGLTQIDRAEDSSQEHTTKHPELTSQLPSPTWLLECLRRGESLDSSLQRGRFESTWNEWRACLHRHCERYGEVSSIAKRYEYLQKLRSVTKAINDEVDHQNLLDLVIEKGMEFVGAERGFLVLVKNDRTEIRVARHLDESDIAHPELSISHSVAGEVARTGMPILLANAVEDDDWRASASIEHLQLLSILCVPLKNRNRVIGALYVDDPRSINRFDSQDLEVLEDFSEHAAIALGKSSLLQENLEKARALDQSKREIERLNSRLKKQLDDTSHELDEVKAALKRTSLGFLGQSAGVVAQSPQMRRLVGALEKIIHAPYHVVIGGESGTGKERIARMIHSKGDRAERPMQTINCAALPDTLIEAELFGYKKGAFTGATQDRPGIFDLADRGTLFLDEIGDMSLDIQKRFLRVLQFGEFTRLGDHVPRHVDVRILSATHFDLKQLVDEGRFREDLFYRLSVLRVDVPPVRERKEDIPLLIAQFRQEIEEEGDFPGVRFSSRVLDRLVSYEWPGNVREISNEVRNLVVMAGIHGRVEIEDLPEHIRVPRGGTFSTYLEEDRELKQQVEEFERERIKEALRKSGGNKSLAARTLGMTPRNLYKKLDRLGLS